MVCDGQACVPDPCFGVDCVEGETCVSGRCVPDGPRPDAGGSGTMDAGGGAGTDAGTGGPEDGGCSVEHHYSIPSMYAGVCGPAKISSQVVAKI